MSRRTQRDRDLDLIAEAGPWYVDGDGELSAENDDYGNYERALPAAARELNRIARERRGKGRGRG